MGDRLSGGVLAAMTGYLLVLQVLMTGFACGSTIPLEGQGAVRFVICHPSDTLGALADKGSQADDRAHECPCAVCHVADPALLAALPQGGDIGPAFTRAETAMPRMYSEAAPPPTPHRLGLSPDRRGPPTLSA